VSSSSAADLEFDSTLSNGLAAMGRHWGLLLVFGILSVIVGVIALIWPGKTVLVFAVFFGAWLLVSGIFQVVEAFSHGLDGGARAMYAISGACGIILGLMCFRGALQAAEIFALLLGLAWLIRGVLTFVAGLTAKGSPGRGWVIFGGIVLFVGGIVIFVWPAISLVTLTIVAGAWLIVFGLIEIFGAFQARKLA
jgi:uncharacterized membrane protein HdeD (DUF308 family)